MEGVSVGILRCMLYILNWENTRAINANLKHMLQCKSNNNSVFEIVLNFSMTGLTALLTEENMMKEIEKDTATMYQK